MRPAAAVLPQLRQRLGRRFPELPVDHDGGERRLVEGDFRRRVVDRRRDRIFRDVDAVVELRLRLRLLRRTLVAAFVEFFDFGVDLVVLPTRTFGLFGRIGRGRNKVLKAHYVRCCNVYAADARRCQQLLLAAIFKTFFFVSYGGAK